MLIYRGREIFLTASEMLKHVARMEHRVIRVLDYVPLHPGYKDVSLA
jgi:hypothetical protein